MKKSELPLYLKISPIYNKILQLAIAIIFMVVLMELFVSSKNQQSDVFNDYFVENSEIQLSQAVNGLKLLIAQNNPDAIQQYIQALVLSPWLEQAHYYDHTGLLIASSELSSDVNTVLTSKEVNDYRIFVEPIMQPELVGYLRFTMNAKQATEHLLIANEHLHETMRLLILFALLIGFLLTRGFARFSRQGMRLAR